MVLAAPATTDATTRWRRLRAPVLTAAGLGAASLALLARDPHRHGAWGLCPFKALTGWDCPACGGLRAVNDLGHGDLAAAWHSNALFISLLPVIGVLWLVVLERAWTGSERRAPAALVRFGLVALGIVALGFTIYRNTPAGAALHAS
ncbi:MAG: DUF2752 domain-containing protein [Marmoricola sp.]